MNRNQTKSSIGTEGIISTELTRMLFSHRGNSITVTSNTRPDSDKDLLVVTADGNSEIMSRKKLIEKMNETTNTTELEQDCVLNNVEQEENKLKLNQPFYMGLKKYNKRRK